MRTILVLAIGDSAILLTLVLLVQHHLIAMYPTMLLTFMAVCVLSAWILLKAIRKSSLLNRTPVEGMGHRGTTRLIWFFSVAFLISIIFAGVKKDPRYAIEALGGALIVGYFVFLLRKLERDKLQRNK